MSGQERTDSMCLSPMDVVVGGTVLAQSQLLCVFGTGDLGRTLGQRLLHAGYRVVYGSRRPHSCGPLPHGVQVLSHAAAVQSASVVFVCVHREHYDFLQTLAPQLKGKVLVDVSNNLRKGLYPEANAVYLQRLVPGASVVKAFNTLSAWALQNGPSDANRQQVFLCGDSAEAKQMVAELSSRLGLGVIDRGSLSASRELEDYPLQLFPQWRLPLRLTAGLVAFFFFYVLTVDVIYSATTVKPEDRIQDRSFRILVSVANKVFPIVSLIMLSLCYLPGVLASILQLYRGTKYRRFPDWLDRWMLCRKQIGLLALALASLHVLYTLIIPQRYFVRDKLTQKAVSLIRKNKTEEFDTVEAWKTDSYFSVGILGFGVYVVLGITSLPSVSNALSWREFSFLQSKLGSLTLFLCTLHTYLYGWNKFLLPKSYKWKWTPPAHVLCLVIPSVVLLGKLLLLLPCVRLSLARIRQGWERSDAAGAERGADGGEMGAGRGEERSDMGVERAEERSSHLLIP